MVDHIRNAVRRITTKYATRDPYELCNDMKILLRYESMGMYEGCCKGFIYIRSRVICITLNSDLPEALRRVVLAHEIGHAVLHRDMVGAQPYHDISLFDETKPAEYEANVFAAELLLSNDDVLDIINDDISFFGVARALYVPPELLDFKWRMMKRDGFTFADSPIVATGDFMRNLEKCGGSEH